MPTRLKHMLTIGFVAMSAGAVMVPKETIARETHIGHAPRAAHRNLAWNGYSYVAPPADFYLARPMPRYVESACDVARDWNC